jgi:small subunit ribosomal protein S6
MATDGKLKQYEAMFLVGPLATAEPENALNICRQMVEKHGGTIIVHKKWDERKLTYELEGQKRGTYIISYFRAPGSAIAPMEREVRLSEQVLRVLITDADHLNEQEMAAVEPQPIIKEEKPAYDREGGYGDRGGDRGDRGDRGPRSFAPRGPRRDEKEEMGAGKPE